MMRAILTLVGLLILSACSSAGLDDYQGSAPQFNFKQFFNGQLRAYGLVKDTSNKVVRRFTVDMNAYWQGNSGVIDEVFYYADGEIQHRTWRVNVNGNKVTGKADDVNGEARGESSGYAFYWTYSLDIPYQGSSVEVNLEDWMYLVTETRLINTTSIVKLGIEVGSLTLIIEKDPATS